MFNKKTKLFLDVVYHEAEDGGDELDGGSFSIDNAYIRNPSIDRLNELVKSETDVVNATCWTTLG
jgi:hypothetical protein